MKHQHTRIFLSRFTATGRPAALRRSLALALIATLGLGGLNLSPAHAEDQLNIGGVESTLLTRSTQQIAPGLDLTSFKRLEADGWNTGNVLTADLTTPSLSLDVIDSGTVTTKATVLEQAKQAGAVAAVNGDFYDILSSGAPVSTNISRASGIRTGNQRGQQALTITDGIAAIQSLAVTGSATIEGTAFPLAGVNTPSLSPNTIGLYTPLWGTYTLDKPTGLDVGGTSPVAQATLVDGVVTEVKNVAGTPNIAPGSQVLLARDAAAATLLQLSVGDEVTVSVGPSSNVDLAISGNIRLVNNGSIDNIVDEPIAGRTAVGINQDGTKMYVFTVDGRSSASHGMTRRELATFMKDLGAYNALNLDGGGSTTMVGRPAGSSDLRVLNTPSDGTEREVANSLAFFSSASSSVAQGSIVAPALSGAEATNILPGLSRTLRGAALAENLERLDAPGEFRITAGTGRVSTLSSTSNELVVRGEQPGTATASFRTAGSEAQVDLRVLGALSWAKADRNQISITAESPTSSVRLTGCDVDGFCAPIEPRDIEVDSPDGFEVSADGAEGFTVRSTVDSGAGLIVFTVGGKTVEVSVTAGLVDTVVSDFSNGSAWTFSQARASGKLTPSLAPNGGNALTMDYDFTQSTATRGAYAVAPGFIPIAGQPQSLSLEVEGDMNGGWPRLQLRDADNVVLNIDGSFITWDGWKTVTFPVPAGVAYPLSFDRIRLMETAPAAQYKGQVSFANLQAKVTPSGLAASTETVHDPLIISNGTVADREQKIAVLSDAQFVGRNPTSELVTNARRALREIVAAKPDLLMIVGDFVDEAAPEDFALAQKILDEEIGTALPWLYVPGNHEIMGGPISNFQSVFGATQQKVQVGATSIITLNSSSGTLRGGGLNQLGMLETALAAAAADTATSGVVVAFHHPIDDPFPDKSSQLADRQEAAAVEQLLGQFRATSGKSVAVVNGHVGAFHASSVNGVSHLINGNSGKSPATSAANGGFIGWTLLGVDPSAGIFDPAAAPGTARTEWLRAEVKPLTDTVSLNVPTTVVEGTNAAISASITQGTRVVPVGWPMSAQWSGDNISIEDGSLPPASSIVHLDPETGQLTALRPGTATVALTVNGVKTEQDITVLAAPDTIPPAIPSLLVSNGKTISGSSEPGATITIRSKDGVELGTGVAQDDGTFSITLSETVPNGSFLVVVATDLASNVSEPAEVQAIGNNLTATLPERLTPGMAFELAASGYVPGEIVTVTIHSDPFVIGTVAADERGTVKFSATLPRDFEPGIHRIEFVGSLSKAVSYEVQVVAAESTTGGDAQPLVPGSTETGQQLVNTGTDLGDLAWWALLLLGGGLLSASASIYAARKTRQIR